MDPPSMSSIPIVRAGYCASRSTWSMNEPELRGYVEISDPDGNPIYIYEEAVAAYAPETPVMRAAGR